MNSPLGHQMPQGKPWGVSFFVPVLALYLFSLPVLSGSWQRLTDVFAGLGSDARYLGHPWLTALHLIPGMVFFLIGPLQFLPRRGRAHRWRGRVFVTSGLLSGAGVIAMVWVFPALGGLMTQLVTTTINSAMAAMMVAAIWCARHRKLVLHRDLMLRAYGLGLSVATARWAIMLAEEFGIGFEESFVLASGFGVILNVVAVEAGLSSKRQRA